MRRPKLPVRRGAPLLLTEAEGRLVLAERKIRVFEQKYGATLAQLRLLASLPPPRCSHQ